MEGWYNSSLTTFERPNGLMIWRKMTWTCTVSSRYSSALTGMKPLPLQPSSGPYKVRIKREHVS
jgi:hypothetical protein